MARGSNPSSTPTVGFASVELRGTFEESHEWHDPLEARVLYVGGGAVESVWISFDLVQPSRRITDYLRKELADNLHIDLGAIATHATHNHVSPFDGAFDAAGTELLSRRLVSACREAAESARRCEVCFVRAAPSERISVRRRAHLAGVGDITSFTHFEDLGGVPDGLANLRERVERWARHLPHELAGMKSFPYDREVDEDIQLLVFRGAGGEVLGSIIRFAAHPIPTCHTVPQCYSADFPHYARSRIEEQLGGMAIYFNGPNGDIAPWEKPEWTVDLQKRGPGDSLGAAWHYLYEPPEAAFSEARRIGRVIADSALSALESQGSFEPLADVRAVSGELCLPVRKDLEPDEKVAEEKTKKLLGRLEELRKAKAPLAEVKRLADQINFYAYQSHVFNVYYYLDEEEFKRGEVRLTLPALCLNDVALVGLPGETFFATGRSVKECLERDGRRVITVSEINGDVGYLPTPEDIPGGDYEVGMSIIDERGEPAIRAAACRLLD